ncbi:MAG: 16S rRNA (guanine(527)-N(7))-methyltransferase RsmG [Clostridiales bacterium]|nr:16S rRNA (guanine(527)-N(7))-methyltransferase RsmG [Clostridiales bacterium]
MTEFLKKAAQAEGFLLSDQQLAAFERYAELLVEWNQKINLTAITEPEEIAVKHFVDSLMLLKYIDLPENGSLIDVGTGAGFPGIPIKIYSPSVQVTLLDALNKRINFLDAVSKELGQENRCLHLRAEEGGRKPELREQFDVATARAVASMTALAEYCLPYVKVGGVFAALKGFEIESELEEAKPAIKLLGGKIERVEQYTLAGELKRSVVVIKKISQSSTKYPRSSAKIAKNPLK